MQKVNSFSVDHTRLLQGIYVSEVNGCFTYDIRFVRPVDARNKAMSGRVIHTLEHFFADWFRNKTDLADKVLYVGPMGCKTGFYLLMTEKIPEKVIAQHLRDCCVGVFNTQMVPGASSISCGNYLYFDLKQTREFISEVIFPMLDAPVLNTEYPFINL